MTPIEELKEKRKTALIVVFTLGLAAIFVESIRPVWMANLFAGTSLDNGAIGLVLKWTSYIFLALVTAALFFVVYLVKFIYYQIEISKLTP